MNRITKRKPPTVGVILREEFIEPYGLKQEVLAKALGVTRTFVNELVNDRRGLSIDTAIMLSKVFNTSPQFWLNIHQEYLLWESLHNAKKKVRFERVINIESLPHKAA